MIFFLIYPIMNFNTINNINYKFLNYGSMPEWLKGVDCKSTSYAYVGSNPTRPNPNPLS